jgi:hypothetical protein
MSSATKTIEAKARFDSHKQEVYLHVAAVERRVYHPARRRSRGIDDTSASTHRLTFIDVLPLDVVRIECERCCRSDYLAASASRRARIASRAANFACSTAEIA